MLIQASQEALLALELFQMDPSAKKSRQLLNQHLVEVAMFEDEEAHSVDEITSAVLKVLNQGVAFSQDECQQALSLSCSEGRVLHLGADRYCLSDETKRKLLQSIERIRQSEKDFDQGLADAVGRANRTVVNPFAEAMLCKIVKEVIQGIFYRHTLKLRELLAGKCNFSVLLEADLDVGSELGGKLETFVSLQEPAAVLNSMTGIRWFLGHLNEAQKHYLAGLHHRVFYFQILNVDPRLQELEEQCFKLIRLYLDTNVVIRYLCEGPLQHEAIADVLNTSKKFGVKLLVTSKTLQESERLVEEAKGFSSYLNSPQIGSALLSNPVAAMNNPIVEAFLAKRRENPNLNWAAFISPFNTLDVYLIAYDIEVSDDNCGDVSSDDFYPRVRAAIEDEKAELTSPHIIEHDTHNLILIHRLRNVYAGTVLGSSVWLITIDKKLPRVDQRLHSTYRQPHCQTVDQWAAVLLPFQNLGSFMATDDYISYLASQRLGALFPEEVLDIHFFKELEEAEVGLDDILKLDPEIAFRSLADLQQDREARTLLARVQSMPEEEKEPTKNEFRERLLTIISRRTEEESERVQEEVNRLQRGIEELSDELRGLESAKTKDVEQIELMKEKLDRTKAELEQYERMSFWERVKYAFRGPAKWKKT
jgi:hypothetical protein